MGKILSLIIFAAVIVSALAFLGVEPLSSYKNDVFAAVSGWWEEQSNIDPGDYAEIFNQYRISEGEEPLTFSDDLNETAALRLEEIKLDFGHFSEGGYNTHLAENIVKGVNNNREALECWMGSVGHRSNMLGSDYKYTGYAAGEGLAVQLFSEWKTVNGEPQLPQGWYFDDAPRVQN